MATPQALTPFDHLCLEALKALGKTLSQMNLYKVGHPAVQATLLESHRLIMDILGQTPNGELAYTIDQSSLIANGRLIGTLSQAPNAVGNLFSRYKLSSLTFKAGLPSVELAALCELAALRPDQAKDFDTAKFLKEREVSHIGLNEAIYAKVGKAAAGPLSASSAAPASVGSALVEKVESSTIEDSLQALVRAVTPDAVEQAKLYEAVMRRLREDLERRVSEATVTIRREKNVLENEQVRTQTVLTNMAEGVVIVDDSGKVLMMNPAAEQIYGARLIDVAGKPLADSVREEHLLTLSSELTAPGDRPINTKVEVVSVDDTRRTLRASAAVVQNEQGKTVGMVSVLPDVTKHKELDKMEREFVAHVTHELRAPLSAIRAALEIMQGEFHGKLEADQERMLNTALKNSDRLADLIRDILDFSKIESGQMTVHPEPIFAGKPANEAVESLQPWAQRKKIQLALDVGAAEAVQVMGDHGRVVQVLVNLLSNAIKFTPVGGAIKVTLRESAQTRGRCVRYAVADSGPGIAKKDQEKIFEKFVQIAAGEKHVGGTGLGLAIARALVQMQKGQMSVESEEGKGATFSFSLPVHVPPADAATPKPARAEAPWWRKLLGLGRGK